MGRADYYKKGQWLVICDVCGMKYHSNDLKMRWDGLMTCRQDWNIRQPQDFVRGIPDPQAIPWSRPDTVPQFITNPVTSAITDFYGEYMESFTNDIMVAFPTTVLPPGIFASVQPGLPGQELEIQDQQTVFYTQGGPLIP